MEYDIEIIVPFCIKLADRIEDFKKYGIFNTSGRKVLVTAVLSNNEEIEGLEGGWHEGVDFRIRKNKCPDHVSNLYKFYADLKPEELKSRWIMRIDDDSCNDISGLIENLDMLYDWEDKCYLGDLDYLSRALYRNEKEAYLEYKHMLGNLERVSYLLKNEIECGIISHKGIMHMLKNTKCMNLIRQRSELRGGYGDCVLALAAALCKFHPVHCPFLSHLPLINEFSLFGGHRNHIHMISRKKKGENFQDHERCGEVQYCAITKSIDGIMSDNEKRISGKRMLMETDNELRVYEFKEDRSLKIKFDERKYIWVEHEGLIKVFRDPREIEISFKNEGSILVGEQRDGKKIELKPINR
jgi:hypothetical protein